MSVTFTELYDVAMTAYQELLSHPEKTVKVNNREYTYRDLSELQSIVEKLSVQAARESGSRPTILLSDISGRPL
jgi:hypothetical protein